MAWRTCCKSARKNIGGLAGGTQHKNEKSGGRLVAVKTGMSIWNSRDFQNVIEDRNRHIYPRRETVMEAYPEKCFK